MQYCVISPHKSRASSSRSDCATQHIRTPFYLAHQPSQSSELLVVPDLEEMSQSPPWGSFPSSLLLKAEEDFMEISKAAPRTLNEELMQANIPSSGDDSQSESPPTNTLPATVRHVLHALMLHQQDRLMEQSAESERMIYTLNKAEYQTLRRSLQIGPFQSLGHYVGNEVRWEYETESERFTILMPMPMRELFARYLAEELAVQLQAYARDDEETRPSTHSGQGYSLDIYSANGSKRSPDDTVWYRQPYPPWLVIEIGFSGFVSDERCRTYIQQSCGKTRAVLVANIQYHPPEHRRHLGTDKHDLSLSLFQEVEIAKGRFEVQCVVRDHQVPLDDGSFTFSLLTLGFHYHTAAGITLSHKRLRHLLWLAGHIQQEYDQSIHCTHDDSLRAGSVIHQAEPVGKHYLDTVLAEMQDHVKEGVPLSSDVGDVHYHFAV